MAAKVKSRQNQTAAAQSPRSVRILLDTTQLVGAQYAGSLSRIQKLRIGDELQLVREPMNAMDSRAIRVDFEGEKVGYISSDHNEVASRLIDAGVDVSVQVIGVNSKARFPREFIRLGIYIDVLKA